MIPTYIFILFISETISVYPKGAHCPRETIFSLRRGSLYKKYIDRLNIDNVFFNMINMTDTEQERERS